MEERHRQETGTVKATIDENGFLIVSAENGTEAYALKNWYQQYTVKPDPDSRSGLIINWSVKNDG